jgi:hypothetical protein
VSLAEKPQKDHTDSWEFDFLALPGESLADYTARATPYLRERYDTPGNPIPPAFLADQAELRWEAQAREAKRNGKVRRTTDGHVATDARTGSKMNLPNIETGGGALARNIDDAEKALIASSEPIFQHGDRLVEVRRGPIVASVDHKKIEVRGYRPIELTNMMLRDILHASYRFHALRRTREKLGFDRLS